MENINSETMFFENENLIWHVIQKYYKNIPEYWDDLYQAGAVQLWKCVENYDESKGRFSTYATRCIRFGLMGEVGNANNVYTGHSGRVYGLVYLILREKNEKSIGDIYQKALDIYGEKVTPQMFNAIYYNVVNKLSVESMVYNDDEEEVNSSILRDFGVDVIGSAEGNLFIEMVFEIAESMRDGTNFSDTSIDMYIEFLKMTVANEVGIQNKLAEKYSVTRQRVSKMVKDLNKIMIKVLTSGKM